jgi:hypothetical protein
MRYRGRLDVIRIAVWVLAGALMATGLMRWRHSPVLAAAGALAVGLALVSRYVFCYWEVLSDRLVEQCFLRRVVFMHREILALEPMGDAVEVKDVRGRRMRVKAANTERFEEDLRECLPALPVGM